MFMGCVQGGVRTAVTGERGRTGVNDAPCVRRRRIAVEAGAAGDPGAARSAFDTLLSGPAKAARMPERERIIEAGAAVAVVVLMLATMVVIGFTHGDDATLGVGGSQLMIGTIVGFIVVVTAVGVALAYVVSDPTPADEDGESEAEAAG